MECIITSQEIFENGFGLMYSIAEVRKMFGVRKRKLNAMADVINADEEKCARLQRGISTKRL